MSTEICIYIYIGSIHSIGIPKEYINIEQQSIKYKSKVSLMATYFINKEIFSTDAETKNMANRLKKKKKNAFSCILLI
jgi:hypothetical protein